MLALTADQNAALEALSPFDGVYELTYVGGTVERFCDTDHDVVSGGTTYSQTNLAGINVRKPDSTTARGQYQAQVQLAFTGRKENFYDDADNPLETGHTVRFGVAWLKADGTYTDPLLSVPWKSNGVGLENSVREGIFTIVTFVSPLVMVGATRSLFMSDNWIEGVNSNSDFFKFVTSPRPDNFGRA